MAEPGRRRGPGAVMALDSPEWHRLPASGRSPAPTGSSPSGAKQAVRSRSKSPGRPAGRFQHGEKQRNTSRHILTRQYARPVEAWISSTGLPRSSCATHSMRRTKATLICRRTGNLRAVQLLPGHTKIDSTDRYLGVEVEDALHADRTYRTANSVLHSSGVNPQPFPLPDANAGSRCLLR